MTDPQPAPGLNYNGAQFLTSARTLAQCPPDDAREVAFIGRSNAGKSSAINVLTGQARLARTSKTPGRTQLLNFFTLAAGRYLVDLPGFGYAKVPPAMKRQWQQQLEKYLQGRQSLRGLVLLMDIRHPFRDFDRLMLEWAGQAGVPLHVLLTKADKLTRGPAQAELFKARGELELCQGMMSVQLFSALKKSGVDELRGKLDDWLTGSDVAT